MVDMKNKLVNLAGLTFMISLIASGCNLPSNPQSNSIKSPTAAVDPATASFSNSVSNSGQKGSQADLNLSVPTPDVARPATETAPQVVDVRLQIDLSRREVSLHQGDVVVKRYPVSVGRSGWETPVGSFTVKQMRKNPVWINPFTDERVPSGTPQNPLGTRWIGFWTNGRLWIGLHGTSDPNSIGLPASHGCIRMHNADIEELFAQIKLSTPVTVVQ